MTILSQQSFKLTDLSALAFACVIIQFPIYRLYIPITIASWVFVTLVVSVFSRNKYEFNFRLIALASLFGLYALGVLWSENRNAANFDLEVKMSMAIIPVVVMYANYSLRQTKFLLYSFLLGLLVAIFWLLLNGLTSFGETGNIEELLYIQLSREIHPSYLAFYMNIAIGFLLIDYMTATLRLFKKKWIYIALICLFAVFSGLLLSKIGFLTTVLLFAVLLVYWLVKRKWALFLSFLIISISVPALIYKNSELVQLRVGELLNGIEPEATERWLESTSLRRVVWEESTDLFKTNLWTGVGTGDVQDVLAARYVEKNINQAAELNLNAHNQFLQTGLALGIGGMILLIFILLQAFIRFKKYHFYNIVFSLIVGLFFFTESVLETQAGVVFVAVFFTIFNSINFTKKENETADPDAILPA